MIHWKCEHEIWRGGGGVTGYTGRFNFNGERHDNDETSGVCNWEHERSEMCRPHKYLLYSKLVIIKFYYFWVLINLILQKKVSLKLYATTILQNLASKIKGTAHTEGVWEQGAEGNVWA
jgi:hypothetical protein